MHDPDSFRFAIAYRIKLFSKIKIMELDRFLRKLNVGNRNVDRSPPTFTNLLLRPYPVQAAKVEKLYTPFKALKTTSCSGGTRPFRPYKGVPWGEKQVFIS